MTDLLTSREAAAQLRVSVKTLRTLPVRYHLVGKRRRYTAAHLEAYLKARTV